MVSGVRIRKKYRSASRLKRDTETAQRSTNGQQAYQWQSFRDARRVLPKRIAALRYDAPTTLTVDSVETKQKKRSALKFVRLSYTNASKLLRRHRKTDTLHSWVCWAPPTLFSDVMSREPRLGLATQRLSLCGTGLARLRANRFPWAANPRPRNAASGTRFGE